MTLTRDEQEERRRVAHGSLSRYAALRVIEKGETPREAAEAVIENTSRDVDPGLREDIITTTESFLVKWLRGVAEKIESADDELGEADV